MVVVNGHEHNCRFSNVSWWRTSGGVARDTVKWYSLQNGDIVYGNLGQVANVGAALVDIYGNLGQVANVGKVFGEIPARNVVVGNTMVACYARAGDVAAAREVFDGMAGKDSISWNTMMTGYLRQGEVGVVRELFEEMPERNVNSRNMMISACSEEGWADAISVFNQMRLSGFEPNAALMAILMSSCAQLGSLLVSGQSHGILKKGHVDMNYHAQNSLADMYAKCGSSQAYLLFLEIHPMGAVMITVLAHHGHGREALSSSVRWLRKGYIQIP